MENIVVDEAREALLKEAEALGLELMKTRPTRVISWLIDKELKRLRGFAKTIKPKKEAIKEKTDGFKQMNLFLKGER